MRPTSTGREATRASLPSRCAQGSLPRATEQPALLHDLPLTADPERVAASFRASVRRNIRTAEKGPAVVRLASSESDVAEAFYGFHVNSRRRLGLPVQPRRFFRLLWSRMIQPDLGRVLPVDADTDTVAGAVFLTWTAWLFTNTAHLIHGIGR